MRNNQAIKAMYLLLAFVPVIFTDCAKDSCKRERIITMYTPVYESKDAVRNNIKNTTPRSIEKPGKIYIRGNTIFLNEIDKGIHVIDNSNPSSPVNTGFINIPGNLDIAVKGNTLYADMYSDMVAIDITNPNSVSVKKFVYDLFPHRSYGNGFVANDDQFIVDWIRKDSVVKVSCTEDIFQPFRRDVIFFSGPATGGATLASQNFAPTGAGTGGSMARFTIVNNHLYTVGLSNLDVFDISNPVDPQRGNTIYAGWAIETIYPFKDKLFLGSQTGMFIYNISDPGNPAREGQFAHASSCDPVIADDNYAYVTLRSGTQCNGFTNQMDIIKLNNLANPVLEKTYQMKNPHGLSKDNSLLFVCDGDAGLKVYNAVDITNLQLLKTISNIMAYDVITLNKVAIVVGDDGLYQYDYSNVNNIRLLSKLTIKRH
jgi:hypothetical protein